MDHLRQPNHWLRYYGNAEYYRWRRRTDETRGSDAFCRPLGLTEFGFDGDGRHFEGRADINTLLETQISSKLGKNAFRERILIAWTRVRCWHSLLRARTVIHDESASALENIWFHVDVFRSVGKAIEAAGNSLIFLEDHFGGDGMDAREFWMHCQNAGRVVEPEKALGKCFVLPIGKDGMLRFQMVMGHEIADGMSATIWMRDFLQALNQTESQLRKDIAETIDPAHMQSHLPAPQEALYPPIPGNIARQRWFWAITRILRHVRKPLPVGFENPLKRLTGSAQITHLPAKFAPLLDYTKLPIQNTHPTYVSIPASGAQRLHRLCKQAHASVGAGIYALAAAVMMEFHEQHASFNSSSPEAFISGFPLNPRAFFQYTSEPDSMMLAFSDGIALPFLPSSLPLSGRLRLLARAAQRQLSTFQKRKKPTGHDASRQLLNSRGAGLVLANQYLFSLERVSAFLSPEQKISPQGAYPAAQNPTSQTHGVSSVGSREHLLREGVYALEDVENGKRDFVADFRDLTSSVRVREGEFLLGIAGSKKGLGACPSVDGTNLDPEVVERWRVRIESILDELDDDDDDDDSDRTARL